ncbi:MAG TPA: hypothetical protein VM848_09455 [Acidimicrobiia bacterium]|nr:hypothetical protein [Acidimicrobiia bacterium]
MSDWVKEHSEAIWTVVVFGSIGLVTLFDDMPASTVIWVIVMVAYGLVRVIVDFVRVLDPELEQYNRHRTMRRHIWILGGGAIALVAWSTFKVEPLPAGIKLDMEAVREAARVVGAGVITGLVAGGLIAAAQSLRRSGDRSRDPSS